MMKCLFFTLLSLAATSCVSVDLSMRKQKKQDQVLSKEQLAGLNGRFYNKNIDTIYREGLSIWATLKPDGPPIVNGDQAIVTFQVLNAKRITANLLRNDSLIDTKKLKFRVKKGFLDTRKYYTAGMIFGPLLWGLSSEDNCIGLTAENNLVIVNSKGGVAMLLFVPTFGAMHQTTTEYTRVNTGVTLTSASQHKP